MTDPKTRAEPAQPRLYAGAGDLPLLIDFASRSTAERRPCRAQWHPGDVVWELRGAADQQQRIRLWFGSEGVELAAWIVSEGELWLEATAGGEARVAEAIEAAEARWRRRPVEQRSATFSVRTFESDAARIEVLERLGYRKGAPEGVHFSMELDGDLPSAEAPLGFSVRDSVRVDPALRAEAHRAAWSHLEHLGINDGESQFSTEHYLSLSALPVYDPTLDMLVVAPDGSFAGNCIAWADARSAVGTFEPVGTALAHRGRRLARLMMAEAVRRLKDRGMREARVSTAHFNASAIAAYLATGFKLVDRTRWWTKTAP